MYKFFAIFLSIFSILIFAGCDNLNSNDYLRVHIRANSNSEEDEIPESDCAMSFYITKQGDTIWEIAKELRVSTDMLLSQNPNLIEPIEIGTKVVVYRQKQVEF